MARGSEFDTCDVNTTLMSPIDGPRLLISEEFHFPRCLLTPSFYYILQIDHDKNTQKIASPFNKTICQHEPPTLSIPFLLKTSRHEYPFYSHPHLLRIGRCEQPFLLLPPFTRDTRVSPAIYRHITLYNSDINVFQGTG